jgi:hypothetical protein
MKAINGSLSLAHRARSFRAQAVLCAPFGIAVLALLLSSDVARSENFYGNLVGNPVGYVANSEDSNSREIGLKRHAPGPSSELATSELVIRSGGEVKSTARFAIPPLVGQGNSPTGVSKFGRIGK